MNIQNVIDLARQLQSIGFGDMSSHLLKRICFKPKSFVLSQQMENGKELIKVQILFQKSSEDTYRLVYYDATLQEELVCPENSINNVSVTHLDKEMAAVNWKKAFELDEIDVFNIEDKISWQKEQNIELIVNDLATLETSEEGKRVAESLKLKYWDGTSCNDLVGSGQKPKNKADVSQRFYLFPNQHGISIDEGIRFLENKRLEKELLNKRKEAGFHHSYIKGLDNAQSTGNGLNKKKRSSSLTTIKKVK